MLGDISVADNIYIVCGTCLLYTSLFQVKKYINLQVNLRRDLLVYFLIFCQIVVLLLFNTYISLLINMLIWLWELFLFRKIVNKTGKRAGHFIISKIRSYGR